MKVLREAEKTTFESLGTQKYEFRACGGSIEPDEKKTEGASAKLKPQESR